LAKNPPSRTDIIWKMHLWDKHKRRASAGQGDTSMGEESEESEESDDGFSMTSNGA
jgi:hypothetical protein